MSWYTGSFIQLYKYSWCNLRRIRDGIQSLKIFGVANFDVGIFVGDDVWPWAKSSSKRKEERNDEVDMRGERKDKRKIRIYIQNIAQVSQSRTQEPQTRVRAWRQYVGSNKMASDKVVGVDTR